MRTIEQMVQQEVECCMSWIIAKVASGYGNVSVRGQGEELCELVEQAFELAGPVEDYEEAAIQAGYDGSKGGEEEWCRASGIEPYQSEVCEHWAVSRWLAEKLVAYGEKVDTDFGNLNIWARRTSGQGISSDGVIERIYADMMKA